MHKLICAVAVLAVSTAQADTIYVDAGNCPGPGNGSELDPYCSIQTAIDNAVNADEIVVALGEYFENINFLGKAITVRSTDPNDAGVVMNTIINGGGSGTVVTCDSGKGGSTVLSGFVITGGNFPQGLGGGMRIVSASPTVSDCIFTGNSAIAGGGMFCLAGTPTIINCTFTGNSASGNGGGWYNSTANPTLTNCTFSENSADNGGGMYNVCGQLTLANCTFTGNSARLNGGGMHNSGVCSMVMSTALSPGTWPAAMAAGCITTSSS